MSEATQPPEFPRPIAVDQLKDREKHFVIEADEAERKALAKRFGILGIDTLKAHLTLKPLAGNMVRLAGRVEAQVHQACVVTLVDVPAKIEEEFERVYSPDAKPPSDDLDDMEFDLDAEEPPDPLVDGIIDIGEAVAEEVALALDPYPRAPGAVFDRPEEGEPEQRQNPFAALAKLKKEK
ncbi:MAG TPA: DUF177 domain-containing protein [Magnetospirillaceae bacterium]|jgi:uncharacterized metal-binding protein YceD (DUF177 family)